MMQILPAMLKVLKTYVEFSYICMKSTVCGRNYVVKLNFFENNLALRIRGYFKYIYTVNIYTVVI